MSSMKRLLMLVLAVCAAPGEQLTIGRGAFGHDHDRPELDGWYSTLRSGKGLCCGGPKIDAVTLDGPQWQRDGGRYRVFLEGKWHDVPADAVVNQPNKDGRALVWPIKGIDGLMIRCFMPGLMG